MFYPLFAQGKCFNLAIARIKHPFPFPTIGKNKFLPLVFLWLPKIFQDIGTVILGRSSYFLGLPYLVSEACLATYKQSDWLSQFFPSLRNAASSNLIGSHSFSQIAGMGKAALIQASGHRDFSSQVSLILNKKIWTNF